MAKEPFRELDIEAVNPGVNPAVNPAEEPSRPRAEGALFITALGLVVERDFEQDGIRVRRRRPGEPGVEPGVEPGGDRQR